MPILSPDGSYAPDQLEAWLRDHRTGLQGLLPLLEQPAGEEGDPLSLMTARDLARDLIALITLAESAPDDLARRIAVVNSSYDGLLAVIDLYKTHAGLPTVPRDRTTPR